MTKIKSVRLVMTEGSSDKEYNIQLVKQSDSEYLVIFQNGKRNGTLKSDTKTKSPVSLADAEKIYTQLYKEKVRKGYLDDGETKSEIAVVVKEKNATLVQLLKMIESEEELSKFMNDSTFVMQEKNDGERRTVNKTESSCVGGNKKGETVGLPKEIIDSLAEETDVELDGEIIGSTLFLFDVLRHNGKNLRSKSYSDRLKVMLNLKLGKSIKVVETAVSKEEKVSMLSKCRAANAEGVVLKKISAPYSVGREASTAFKYKFYETATVKVSGLTKGKRSVQMAVLHEGAFVDVGAVTVPSNKAIPEVNEFIEVRYLYAYKGGSLFQPTFLFSRNDVDETDTVMSQLKYKRADD